MGTLIRNGVFETNSSSTHTLSIGTSGDLIGLSPNTEDGGLEVEQNDFGWSFDCYSKPEDRISYALLYVRDWSRDCKEQFSKILEEVVKEHTGALFVRLKEQTHKWGNGYIDHQSVENKDLHYLFENPELLKTFLFSKDGYVETGNDN